MPVYIHTYSEYPTRLVLQVASFAPAQGKSDGPEAITSTRILQDRAAAMRSVLAKLTLLSAFVSADQCAEELKSVCGADVGNTKACESCAESHTSQLTKAGCTRKEVIQLCQSAPGPAPRPGPAPPCYSQSNVVYNCSAPCFCEPKWKRSDVLDQDNIVFSDKYNLSLHMSQPPASDLRTHRPAVVAIHGAGFTSGDRNDKKGLVDWCYRLATMGYVTVSIDYRLLGQNDTENSNLQAMYDAKAAVRWLRKNAAHLRVDTTRIAAFGSSAGAMTTAFLAYVSDKGEGDSGNPGFSSQISAGISLSGALIYLNYNDSQQNEAKPFLDFHGCSDHTVPYSCVDFPGGPGSCWGSGVDTVAQWKKEGAVADIYSFPGKGHVPWSSLAASPAADSMVGFLAQHLDLAHAQCP